MIIANAARSASLAVIISYPTSVSGIILLLNNKNTNNIETHICAILFISFLGFNYHSVLGSDTISALLTGLFKSKLIKDI